MTYVAGKSADVLKRELGVETVVKLGSNESPIGPSARAVEAITTYASQSHIYPGPELRQLHDTIAEGTGLSPANVVIGNGSCDVLLSVAAQVLTHGDEAIIPEPSFAMYRIGARAAGATAVGIPHRDYAFDIDAIRAAVTPRTRMLFLTNPNNPTGLVLTRTQITDLLDALPDDVLVVLDEAYGEFVDDDQHVDGVDLLREGRNIIVTRTFSKIYALAGLRVGYGLTTPKLADQLRAVQPPFHTGSLALRAANAAFADREHLELSRRVNREGRSYLTAELTALGLRVLPSEANHVLVVDLEDVPAIDAALNARGVISRPTGPSFDLKGGLRVTVGTPQQNQTFIAALREALHDLAASA
ncbi:histidinol-phosphate transaminase [Embleya scabrispora]|uniref:histidinol-phosphate transaminase n=1 Tax=Embleya scabrispora TaxID=159449 RepID=UPI0003628F5B|nr:histidinol-phosphate transaminase [Embleya scabrispora]MYS85106.1 histidinol-phosphate transaminase [Streptomyces sp. SID5474]